MKILSSYHQTIIIVNTLYIISYPFLSVCVYVYIYITVFLTKKIILYMYFVICFFFQINNHHLLMLVNLHLTYYLIHIQNLTIVSKISFGVCLSSEDSVPSASDSYVPPAAFIWHSPTFFSFDTDWLKRLDRKKVGKLSCAHRVLILNFLEIVLSFLNH